MAEKFLDIDALGIKQIDWLLHKNSFPFDDKKKNHI
jgi:hypothetical protein